VTTGAQQIPFAVSVAAEAAEEGSVCMESDDRQVVVNKARSSPCSLGDDRMVYAAPCTTQSHQGQATLPQGRYVKVVQRTAGRSEVCDVKVYGLPADPASLGVAAKAISVKAVDYSDESAFAEQFQSELGLDTMQPMLVRVTGTFEMDFLDAGEYAFNLISSDGSLLVVDGETVVSNDGLHGTVSASGEVQLDAGTHKLELLYFKRLRGHPVLKLRWGGGPHKLKRRTFEFEPVWEELRVSIADPTCSLRAPNMNEAGVPILYGFTQCHSSCASCVDGGEGATDCTMCNPETPHHTILNPRFGSGTCTSRICPLCKPRECCGPGHQHFIIDSESQNGVCIKPTDDCKAHCVTNPLLVNGERRSETMCTKGCNDIIKVPGLLDVAGIQLSDIVICQALKTVTCTTPEGNQAISTPSNRRGLLSISGGGIAEPIKICSSKKDVTCQGVCPDLSEADAAEVWGSGPTCVLDILSKIQCDRDSEGACLRTAAGAFVGCTVLNPAPFACPASVFEYVRQFLSCKCHLVPQQNACSQGSPPAAGYQPLDHHKRACETVASTF